MLEETEANSLAEKLLYLGRIDPDKKEYYCQHDSRDELLDYVQTNLPFLVANESEFY